MDGIFMRRKTNAWPVFLLLCGIVFLGLYAFRTMAEGDAVHGELVFLFFGILLSVAAFAAMRCNYGAYLRVEENTIRAKYHWFGRMDCRIDEVAFALAQINSLTILLKSGKLHVIRGLENSWDLCAEIRRQSFSPEEESAEALRQKLEQVRAARRKELWWVIGGITFMFANIFLAVLLTGGRDPHEFGKTDWIAFAAMGFIELITLVGLFYAAARCGQRLLPMEQLKYRLRGARIVSQPLPWSNIKNVYTDENYTGRVIVCGFPGDESVYYCVQEFRDELELATVYTSEIFGHKDELPAEGFDGLLDITEQIL